MQEILKGGDLLLTQGAGSVGRVARQLANTQLFTKEEL